MLVVVAVDDRRSHRGRATASRSSSPTDSPARRFARRCFREFRERRLRPRPARRRDADHQPHRRRARRSLQDMPREAPAQRPSISIPFPAIICSLFVILMMSRGRGRRRRYWGGPRSGWNSGVGPFGGGIRRRLRWRASAGSAVAGVEAAASADGAGAVEVAERRGGGESGGSGFRVQGSRLVQGSGFRVRRRQQPSA